MTNLQCAKRLHKLAKWFNEVARSPYAKRHGLIRCYKSDAKQLLAIAEALESGDSQMAQELTADLDTLLRESIDDASWRHLQKRQPTAD